MSDLTRMTATEIAGLVASRETSAVEVTQAHLGRIAAVDDRAFDVCAELAPEGVEVRRLRAFAHRGEPRFAQNRGMLEQRRDNPRERRGRGLMPGQHQGECVIANLPVRHAGL